MFVCFVSASVGFIGANSARALAKPTSAPQSRNDNVGWWQDNNIWSAIRNGFRLDHHDLNPAVDAQIRWFERNPHYFYRICQRARPYLYYILQQAQERHMPTELVLLPMIESAFNPFVSSSKGAAGLWQIMPITATTYGLHRNWWYDGRRDVYHSTTAAFDYLSYLSHFFDGNWDLAIAAYDSGEGTVFDAMRRNARRGESQDFWDLHLPQETRAYVPRLLAIAAIIRDPEEYGIKLPNIPNQPYFATVRLHSQIDLANAAKLAGVSVSEMYILNPGYNRWATAPHGSHLLLLPVGHVAKFKANLAKQPASQRVTWRRHVIKDGDTLSALANHYRTSVHLLRAINKLKDDTLHLGGTLFIPLAKRLLSAHSQFNHLYHIPKYFTHNVKHLPHKRLHHTVREGDSLWKIAKDNGVSIHTLRRWNHFSRQHTIKPGDKITLWVITPDSYQTSRHHHSQHHARRHQHLSHYIVKSGDNLKSIAHHFGLTSGVLKQANHLHSSVIKPHQNLVIPAAQKTHQKKAPSHAHHKTKAPHHTKATHHAKAPPHPVVHHATEGPVLPKAYKVQEGDTLSEIAARNHVTVDAIKHENGLSINELQIGQVLDIPRTTDHLSKHKYIVQAGDNLSTIAKRFGASVKQLKAENHLTSSTLHLKQVLHIPRR